MKCSAEIDPRFRRTWCRESSDEGNLWKLMNNSNYNGLSPTNGYGGYGSLKARLEVGDRQLASDFMHQNAEIRLWLKESFQRKNPHMITFAESVCVPPDWRRACGELDTFTAQESHPQTQLSGETQITHNSHSDTDYTQRALLHRLHTTHTSSKTHNSHSDTALLTTHTSHNSHSNTDYTQLTQLTPTESHRWAASLVLHKFSTETAANPRIIWYRCGVGRIDPGWLFVRASRDELHSLLGSA